jgi:hypothetical protein
VSTGRADRTGARRVATPAAERETASHRGVRWRKDPDGTIGWYNEEAGGWLRWRPGADAPPVPPQWEADAARIPAPPRVRRAPWRSPYRLVPVVLILAAVAVGAWQAGRQSGVAATRLARQEARALVGHCLARTSQPGQPVAYGTRSVPCGGSSAALRVVAVHLVSSSSPGPVCRPGQTVLQLSYAGTHTADVECTVPVHR